MPRPARDVPIAMVGSVAVNGILGLGYCIMLLFSLGDLNECKQFFFSFSPFVNALMKQNSTFGKPSMRKIVDSCNSSTCIPDRLPVHAAISKCHK